MKPIKLEKKRAYGYIIIDIPEENAFAKVQVRTEEEGIAIFCLREDGSVITNFELFYDDLQKEVVDGISSET